MNGLSAGKMFRSLDRLGDFVGELMYVRKVFGSKVSVVFSDGHCATYEMHELNVDYSSIRDYDPDVDEDYIGLTM